MNKLMAILFLLGAIAGFGMSQRSSYWVQPQDGRGNPVGEPRMAYVRSGDKIFFISFGAVCMVGCLYCLARTRKEDVL